MIPPYINPNMGTKYVSFSLILFKIKIKNCVDINENRKAKTNCALREGTFRKILEIKTPNHAAWVVPIVDGETN